MQISETPPEVLFKGDMLIYDMVNHSRVSYYLYVYLIKKVDLLYDRASYTYITIYGASQSELYAKVMRITPERFGKDIEMCPISAFISQNVKKLIADEN